MYAEDMTYITRMDDTVFLGTTAIDIRTFCELFGITIDNGIERRIQMLKDYMVMNKRASLPSVNLDGVVKEFYSKKYDGLNPKVTFIDELPFPFNPEESFDVFNRVNMSEIKEAVPDYPKLMIPHYI